MTLAIPADLRALVGAPKPDDLGGPAMAPIGARNAFVWFDERDGGEVRVWTPPDGSEVWMVSVENPAFATDPQAVRDELGEPELSFDAQRGGAWIEGAEWAYPGRGVTVFADTEDERVFRIAVYPPCAAGEYAALYGSGTAERRRPEA